MIIRLRNIILLFPLLIAVAINGLAQTGLYVPRSAKIFFAGDSATIFTNVYNDGQFGIGRTAVVNFKGVTWNNDISSRITDESELGNGVSGIGGIVRFLAPDQRLTGTASAPQFVTGG